MRIRTKLTYLFTVIVTLIILLGSLAIYNFSAVYRRDEFYSRLEKRAETTARLFIKVKEVDSVLLRIIDRNSVVLEQESIVVYGYLNNLLYRSSDSNELVLTKQQLNDIRLNKKLYFNDGKREAAGMLYSDQHNHFVVAAAAHDRYGLNKLHFLRLVLVIVGAGSILVTLAAGWFYSGQVLNPINRIISQVDQISASRLNARLNEGNQKDEIANLAITFNNMLDRLESAFQMQRNFVSYASHELRTPLTAVTAQLEVMLQKDRDMDHYTRVAVSVLDDIKKLNGITNGLITMANASLDSSAITFKPLRVDDLLWKCEAELRKNHPDYTVKIDFDSFPEDESELMCKANDQLIGIAFLNLMDNACKFSNDKTVRVNLTPGPATIRVQFSDRGIGIPEEEIEQIFEPFYRGANAAGRRGHGLGMALTRRVIDLHKGKLSVVSRINDGTVFTVELPVA